jgi:hypothetical protein
MSRSAPGASVTLDGVTVPQEKCPSECAAQVRFVVPETLPIFWIKKMVV